MIELTLFIILNILGAITTLLIIGFKQLPDDESDNETSGLKGMAFLCALISTIIWIITAVCSVSLGYTQPYAVFNNSSLSVLTGTYEVIIPNTWPFALVYALVSVLPFVLIFYFFPESWKQKKNE